MSISNWLSRLLRPDCTTNIARKKRPTHRRSWPTQLRLERLEDRLAPAANITIISGAAGSGSLDSFLSATKGAITTANDPGDTAATLSTGALQGVGTGVAVSIAADTAIHFNDIGTLTLLAGHGITDTFQTTNGAIDFANAANMVNTSGGSLVFRAGAALSVANLNANSGNVSLAAGTAAAGSLTVNAVNGAMVTVATSTGSVTSAGSANVEASAQLTVAAATGIGLNTQAASLAATNSTSGNIAVSNTGALTIAAPGVIDMASNGTVTLSTTGALTVNANVTATGMGAVTLNAGPSLSVAASATIQTGGMITLNGDFHNVGSTTIMVRGASLRGASATINGNNSADVFDVSPSAFTPITVDGKLSATSPGDALNLDLAGISGAVLYLTGAGAGLYNFGSGAKPFAYDGIESYATTNGSYHLVLDMALAGFQDGNTAPDTVTINAANALFTLLAGKDGAMPTTFFSSMLGPISSFTLMGKADPVTVNVLATPANFVTNLNGQNAVTPHGMFSVNVGSMANSLGTVMGLVMVNNGTGPSSITLNDQGTMAGIGYIVTNNLITRTGAGNVIYTQSRTLNLTLNGAQGGDSFNIASTDPRTSTMIMGGAGNDSFVVNSDVSFVNNVATGLAGPLHIDAKGGANSLFVSEMKRMAPDALYINAATITNGNSMFSMTYTATGGTFGRGISVVGTMANEMFVLESKRSDSPMLVAGVGSNDMVTVLVTANSGYQGVTLVGGMSSLLMIRDITGGAVIHNMSTMMMSGAMSGTITVMYPMMASTMTSMLLYENFTNVFTSPMAM
jgi:hypothetical protein